MSIKKIKQFLTELPPTVKWHFATLNPRPIGFSLYPVIMNGRLVPEKCRLDDGSFSADLAGALLRHPQFGNDSEYLALFDHLEASYAGLRSRKALAKLNESLTGPLTVPAVMGSLKDDFATLSTNLHDWLDANLQNSGSVALWVTAILGNENSFSGNAEQDLRTWQPQWAQVLLKS